MNVPAVLNLFRVIRNPSLCLPHYTVATFDELPIPLSKAFASHIKNEENINIRAVVLDKDNCFAVPKTDHIHPPYSEKFKELIKTYSASNILIVSNSSGTASKDPSGAAADQLEQNTGVKVLRHTQMKPACEQEILDYFQGRISSPSQIAVIGDRMFTDVVMANRMGARAIWIREGVVPDRGIVTRVEYAVSKFLINRGYTAPEP